jgi:hypothetical protein
MARPHPALDPLLALLDEGFAKKAWHGPNLRGSLRGVSAAQAAWRPGRGRHNIWELAVHAAYWKYTVRRRLTGEKRGSFALAGSNWFERPDGPATDAAWKKDVALLLAEHRRLRDVVTRLAADSLRTKAPGGKDTSLRLIEGIALHDVYHAGQIQLLKRLQAR